MTGKKIIVKIVLETKTPNFMLNANHSLGTV